MRRWGLALLLTGALLGSVRADDLPQLAIEEVSVERGPQTHVRATLHNTGESTVEGPLHLTVTVRSDGKSPWRNAVDQVIDKVPRDWKVMREAYIAAADLPEATFQMRITVVLPGGQEVGTRLFQVLPPGGH